jgi:hypothetical protein
MPGKDLTTAQFTIPCTSSPVSPRQVREVLTCTYCGLVQFRTGIPCAAVAIDHLRLLKDTLPPEIRGMPLRRTLLSTMGRRS